MSHGSGLMLRMLQRLALGTALVLPVGLGCADSAARRDAGGREPSLEYKLAVIDRSGYVAEDDPLVARFSRALDHLEAKCPETRQRLADMGVKGHQILREKNIREALLDVFENWGASIPAEATKGEVGPCADILAAYVTLRIGG